MRFSATTGKTTVERADVRLAERFCDLLYAAEAMGQGEVQAAAKACGAAAKRFLATLRETDGNDDASS